VLEQHPAARGRRRLADQLEAEHAGARGAGDGGAGLGGEMRAASLERAGCGAALDVEVSRGQVEHAGGRGERGPVAHAGRERVFDQPKRIGHGKTSGLSRVSLGTLYES